MFLMCVLVIGLTAIALAIQTYAPQEQLESIPVRVADSQNDNHRNGRYAR
jgi:hypothetical protein